MKKCRDSVGLSLAVDKERLNDSGMFGFPKNVRIVKDPKIVHKWIQ